MFQIRLIAYSLLMAFMLAPLHAQRTGSSSGGGGTGRASDSVLGTWEASGVQTANRLDLLVLWRGRPGWFANAKDMAVGGSEHLHRFNTGDVRLELRFDPTTRLVSFQGRSVPIGDDNVVLVDKVDDPSGPTIVGTMRVDPRLPDPAVGDPVQQIVKGSPKLAAFVQ